MMMKKTTNRMTDKELMQMGGDCGLVDTTETHGSGVSGLLAVGLSIGFMLLMNICAHFGH